MYLTREFQKAVIVLFLLALLMTGVSIIMQVNEMHGLSLSGPNTAGRIILTHALYIIEIIALWVAIAYITKEKTGAAVALGLQVALMLFTLYYFVSKGVTEETIQTLSMPKIIVQLLSYAAFGLIHFKKHTGLLMVLVSVVFTGMGAGFNGSGFYDFLNNLLHIAGIDNFMQFELQKSSNTTRMINLFIPLIGNLYLPIQLITFWFIYTKVKFPQSFNKSLTIVHITGYISQGTFSVIYWVLRISLFVIALGIIGFISRAYRMGWTYYGLYAVISFCLAIFVIGSMYRNFLVAYFISKGRNPSWLYLLLQIPVLHIFGWIITFLFKPKPLVETTYAIAETETPATSLSPARVRLAQAKEDYEYSSKNTIIKWILIIILFCMWILPFLIHPLRSGIVGASTGMTLMVGIINFTLSLWYIFDRRAFMPLIILQTIAVFVFYLTQSESMMHPILTFGLVNMVVYYALFHFTGFEFIEDGFTQPVSPPADDELLDAQLV